MAAPRRRLGGRAFSRRVSEGHVGVDRHERVQYRLAATEGRAARRERQRPARHMAAEAEVRDVIRAEVGGSDEAHASLARSRCKGAS
eukprot:4059946-Pleurochrysis_carterae.AAC.2